MSEFQGQDYRLHYVRLWNKGATTFTDMYDGVPYSVEGNGGSQNLPPEVAAHFFGYFDGATREQMFRHTCKRQGWNTPAHLVRDESGRTLAERLFDQYDIAAVAYRMVEDTPDLDAPIPADPTPELPASSKGRRERAGVQ